MKNPSGKLLIGMVCVIGTTFSTLSYGQRVMVGVNFDGATSIVSDVVVGGPAEAAGIKIGDEIMSIGEAIVLQPEDLVLILHGKKPGDKVRLEVRRGQDVHFFDVELVRATLPGEPVQYAQPKKEEPNDEDLGIVGKPAPELAVDQWVGLAEGQDELSLESLKGKTTCLLFFQANCVSSRRQAIPVFRRIVGHLGEDDRFAFAAIQTAFEAFDVNTLENAQAILDRAKINVPLGHDGNEQQTSRMAEAFNSGGTPWTVIIGPDGTVEFDGFNIGTTRAVQIMKKLADGE